MTRSAAAVGRGRFVMRSWRTAAEISYFQIKSNLFASTKYKEKQLKNIRLTHTKSKTNRL